MAIFNSYVKLPEGNKRIIEQNGEMSIATFD